MCCVRQDISRLCHQFRRPDPKVLPHSISAPCSVPLGIHTLFLPYLEQGALTNEIASRLRLSGSRQLLLKEEENNITTKNFGQLLIYYLNEQF